MKFINAYNVSYTPERWLSYDDVSLLPKPSKVMSRNDPRLNLSCKATYNTELSIPIISSPMSTVTGADMAIAINKLGGLGILHRFHKSSENYLAEITNVYNETGKIAFSVGLNNDDVNFIGSVISRFGRAIVCVDVAHGHLQENLKQIFKINSSFKDKIEIIAGSACTASCVEDLIMAGASGIRVGVGPGSLCTTRLVTGHGTPQLTAIMQARAVVSNRTKNCKIIADGGIRYPGDIIKALAAGADCVMIGNLLAGTDESPGDIQENDLGKKYKRYYGQSSQEALDLINKTNVTAEGEGMNIPYRGAVADVIKYLVGGIKSGMSYSGVYNLDDLYNNAVFIEITQAGQIESQPHGLHVKNV